MPLRKHAPKVTGTLQPTTWQSATVVHFHVHKWFFLFFFLAVQVLLMFRLMFHSCNILCCQLQLQASIDQSDTFTDNCTKHNCVIRLLLLGWTAPFSGHCCCVTCVLVHLLHTFCSLFIHIHVRPRSTDLLWKWRQITVINKLWSGGTPKEVRLTNNNNAAYGFYEFSSFFYAFRGTPSQNSDPRTQFY